MANGICPLSNRCVIMVAGADRISFINGLCTNIVGNAPVWTAFCNPQGMVLCTVFAVDVGGTLYIDCPTDYVMELGGHLQKYVLQADVQLGMAQGWTVHAVLGDGMVADCLGDSCIAYADPRLPQMGYRIMGRDLSAYADLPVLSEQNYTAHRHAHAIPDDVDITAGRTIPLEFGFAELNAIDFAKGCYTGQESIARTKNRTPVRRRLLPIQWGGDSAVAVGDTLRLNGKNSGDVVAVGGQGGMALVRCDRLNTAPDSYTLGDTTATIHLPDWVKLPQG